MREQTEIVKRANQKHLFQRMFSGLPNPVNENKN